MHKMAMAPPFGKTRVETAPSIKSNKLMQFDKSRFYETEITNILYQTNVV